ncbi:hypothetical protein [Ferroplasma sp.]|jgi:hypothetical protein|uniref:hypothetical protein n=1 Tax=Ferroplasma sp. TaxID=2591003 RepID=UPI001823675D|nr:hypothetical protein [Ferroplasma sp.]HII83137.1 hypothetical protein [Ferroplasma sp.]
MISKKILSIIIGIVIVGAGAGTYFVLSNQGDVNPGIQISSVTSNSNTTMNNSLDVPIFSAHVHSSKTAEYEVISNGNIIFSGIVTGNQVIKFPSTFSQIEELSNVLSPLGLHSLTFKVVYNSYSTSKTVQVYTFPHISFSYQHGFIDTGVSDKITASTSADNLTFCALGVTHAGNAITITPTIAGNISVNYSISQGNYHFSSEAEQIQVYNPPKAVSISASNISYNSTCCCTTFDANLVSSGGDVNGEMCYYIYVNDSCQFPPHYFTSHSPSYSVNMHGSGPFNVYFIVKDNYYNSTSNTIRVD